MALWHLLPLLLLSIITNHAWAANISLSPELTNFVPPCSQECFASFLETNFPSTICSNTPSLECLCSRKSTSGHTVGEGAVQCIISEINIGFCKGADAARGVVTNAYAMCNGQADALPNTHGTLTATLVIQTSMPSVVLIAPRPSTSRTSSSAASSTALSSGTTAPSQSSSIPSPTASPSTQALSDTAALVPALSRNQIVAISVASVGGTAALLGILLLFVFLRRRRRAARDSDMLPFQLDPSNSTKESFDSRSPLGKMIMKGGTTPDRAAARIPPQVPPRLDISTPNMFSRRSIVPDTIGLAISPGTPTPMKQRRHASKLLPEKPILSFETPQQPLNRQVEAPKNIHPGQQGSEMSRQSTATQFEEDEQSAVVSAKVKNEESWMQRPVEPPGAFPGDWRPTKPNVVAIPPPVAVAAGGANLWSNVGAPNTVAAIVPQPIIKPLNLSRSANSFSQPRRTDENFRPRQKLQLQVPVRPTTTSSSVYSARGSSINGVENSRISGPPRSRRSYRQAGPYDVRESGGSLTSFETNDSIISPQEPEPRTAGTDLSPVVESPTGTSPVSYPRIPARLSDAAMRMMPPPPQPDFGPAKNIPLWKQAELAAQRQRMGLVPFQANSIGPEAPTGDQLQQRSMHNRQRSRDYIAPSAVYNMAPSNNPSSGTSGNANQLLVANPGGNARGNLTVGNLTLGPAISFSRTSSVVSQASKASASTTATGSSSLLAKRRGEQKAQALIGSLQNGRTGSDEERKKAKTGWRVLKDEDKDKAKSPLWKPMSGSGESSEKASGGAKDAATIPRKSAAAREERTYFEQTELPRTPGWIPKLTPTRRGDELFLSVQ